MQKGAEGPLSIDHENALRSRNRNWPGEGRSGLFLPRLTGASPRPVLPLACFRSGIRFPSRSLAGEGAPAGLAPPGLATEPRPLATFSDHQSRSSRRQVEVMN